MDKSYFFSLVIDGTLMAGSEDDARQRIMMEFNRLPGWNVQVDYLEVEDDDEE